MSAHRPFDIARAGKIVGLLNVAAPGTPTTPQIHVVLNWLEELKQRVPVKIISHAIAPRPWWRSRAQLAKRHENLLKRRVPTN